MSQSTLEKATPISQEEAGKLPRFNLPNPAENSELSLLALGRPSYTKASPETAFLMTTEEFKKRHFTACPGSDGVLVLTKPLSVADLENLASKVSRTSSGDSDFNYTNFKDRRVNKNGPYFQYRNHEDKPEPPLSEAHYSVNGAMIKILKAGVQIETPVLGGEPEIAKQIHDLMLANNKKVLGIRPFDYAEGGFTIFYSDMATNKTMATVFYLKSKPNASDPKSIKEHGDLMQRALVPVLKKTL